MKPKSIKPILILLFFIFSFPLFARGNITYYLIVSKDGKGNYTALQAAINAAPSRSNTPFKIFVKKGKYVEQVIIPKEKPFIEIVGEDAGATTISFGDGNGGTSAFTIDADNCFLMNLTIENSQGAISDGPQSLAIRTNGSREVFYNCRFISGQDTVLVSTAGALNYFNNCYIDGNTDFIFGAAVAVFDQCVIYCRDRLDGSKGGYLTAASTPKGQAYGLVFRDCALPTNHGITSYTLGRPWQNDAGTELAGRKRAENKVVFLNTKMGASIQPQGWSVWNQGTITDVITYAEYHTTNLGSKAVDVSKRLPWTKQLTAKEAEPYFDNRNIFGAWYPASQWGDFPQTTVPPLLTITNFIARKHENNALLQFNVFRPVDGAGYTLYKAEEKHALFTVAGNIKVRKGSTVAFQFTEALPVAGETVYYKLVASKDESKLVSDTLEVNLETMKSTSWAKRKL